MPESHETDRELLDRILRAVEKDVRKKWVDAACTVLLSLATLVSGWCVYEASQWNGEQYFAMEDYNGADRRRLQWVVAMVQRHAAESAAVLSLVEAQFSGNSALADALMKHFPPHLRSALLAWQQTDPFNNSEAPASPFLMPEYVPPEIEEIEHYAAVAEKFRKKAEDGDKFSDAYVLISVLMAIVLFCSGISGVIDSYVHQKILLGLATLTFLTALGWMLQLPVLF